MMKSKISIAALALVTALVFMVGDLPTVEARQDHDVKNEVVKLLKADVDEEVVLRYIRTTGIPEKLDAQDIVELKKVGATPAILLALMGESGTEEFPFDLDENHEVAGPITHGPMAVYPILRKGPVSVDTYLTLDEATEQKVITITEKGGGSVPVVTIQNTGKLPVYISSGEVVVGGKQDRMVAYDVIIKPAKKLTVEVRCVERGRWQGRSQAFSSARAMGNLKSRYAVQFKGQGDVWQEVAAQNQSVSTRPGSGTYQATLTSPKVQKLAKGYAKAILPALGGRHVVGMVVAINGKVHAIEMYGSPGLFAKMKDKLLRAYVLDVVAVKDEGAAPPGRARILDFYKKTMAEQEKELKAYESNRNVYRASPEAVVNDSVDESGIVIRRQLLSK